MSFLASTNRSAERPCAYIALEMACWRFLWDAANAVIMPVRTSPVPAFARLWFALVLTNWFESGVERMVFGPFKTKKQFNSAAFCFEISNRFRSTSLTVQLHKRAISPVCGVKIEGLFLVLTVYCQGA